jgi:phosphohistidine phosphatase SixA
VHVSDLHCPARVLLARHGEAEYETPLLMNHGGSLTTAGRAQARELGERLREERIAHVYTFKDRLVSKVDSYEDRDEALRVAGIA